MDLAKKKNRTRVGLGHDFFFRWHDNENPGEIILRNIRLTASSPVDVTNNDKMWLPLPLKGTHKKFRPFYVGYSVPVLDFFKPSVPVPVYEP